MQLNELEWWFTATRKSGWRHFTPFDGYLSVKKCRSGSAVYIYQSDRISVRISVAHATSFTHNSHAIPDTWSNYGVIGDGTIRTVLYVLWQTNWSAQQPTACRCRPYTACYKALRFQRLATLKRQKAHRRRRRSHWRLCVSQSVYWTSSLQSEHLNTT